MKSISVVFFLLATLPLNLMGQSANPEHYRIYTGNGSVVSFEAMIGSFAESDVVFLGEFHDDSVGHALELDVFRTVFENYGKDRKVALSLEMFESDVQSILDEYLAGLITEDHFLASSRPWKNYKTDYRPLVEFAKEKKLPIVAANAPRRYVNMVSRGGRAALTALSRDAKKTLAPLPYPESSPTYREKFLALMKDMPAAAGNNSRLTNILESQTLWDSTMGYRVARFLKKNKRGLVVHMNGSFHTESRLGTAEQFARYKRSARFQVVTIRYEDDFKRFEPARHKGLGDFVILTDGSQPRSGK